MKESLKDERVVSLKGNGNSELSRWTSSRKSWLQAHINQWCESPDYSKYLMDVFIIPVEGRLLLWTRLRFWVRQHWGSSWYDQKGMTHQCSLGKKERKKKHSPQSLDTFTRVSYLPVFSRGSSWIHSGLLTTLCCGKSVQKYYLKLGALKNWNHTQDGFNVLTGFCILVFPNRYTHFWIGT